MFSGFSPSTKNNISKFQFNQGRGPADRGPAKTVVASSANIIIYVKLFQICKYYNLCQIIPNYTEAIRFVL